MIRKFLPAIAATALALGAQATAPVQAAFAPTVTHKVLGDVLESGNPQQTLPSGYTTIETATLNCVYGSCTVNMNVMSNVGNATCMSQWAIVGLVDGKSVDGGPLLGDLPKPGKFQTRTWQGNYPLAYGKHTIAFQIYVPCPVTAYQWSVEYVLAQP